MDNTMGLWSDFLTNDRRLIHKWKHYFPVYERHFGRFINTDVVLIAADPDFASLNPGYVAATTTLLLRCYVALTPADCRASLPASPPSCPAAWRARGRCAGASCAA